ncbi:MAG: DNA primase [Spirochaetes bacterium]|nr:DNA primase [Spirochaetota bacterium]
MRISDEVKKEIIEKVCIEEIVSSYVNLKRTGRSLKGLCPFHAEKTPSFNVTPDKGTFYCFGCQKGGDVITFVMEIEKLTYPEALQFLAQKAGINLDFEESESAFASEESKFKKQLFSLYDKITSALNYILLNKPYAEKALEYLISRGVSQDLIEKFQLGYIPPDRKWLYNFLRKKSYSEDFLAKTGLFSSNYKDISIFSGRIIFPIFSKSGKVIAFGGRSMDFSGKPMPKYINSPESPIFKKSEELYGLNFAQKEIRKSNFIYIVEGYTDVIAMFQAGVENCVAPLGTAFTENHADIIRKNCSQIILVFDNDEAGFKATVKSAYICEKAGLVCSVIVLPEGSDPADILKKQGKEALKNILKYPINSFGFLINKYKTVYNLSKEEGIKDYLNKLFAFVSISESEVTRSNRLKAIAEILDTDYANVYDDYIKYFKKDDKEIYKTTVLTWDIDKISPELYLMLAVIDNYDYFYMVRDELSVDNIHDKTARNIYIVLEEAYRNNSFSLENMLEKIENSNLRSLIRKKLSSEEFSVNPKQLIDDSINVIKLKNLQTKRVRIEKIIAKDDGSDPYQLEKLIEEKLFYDKEIEKLKGTNVNNV